MSERTMKADHQHRYEGSGLTVLFDKSRCIHAAECVRGLPDVFDTRQRPWVQVDRASRQEVLAVVERCPSGALRAIGPAGERLEEEPSANTVRVQANGPLQLRGRIELANAAGDVFLEATRLTLCRCGASKNKPFCDNSHRDAGFSDPGPESTVALRNEPDSVSGNALRVTVRPNSSLAVDGAFTLHSSDGSISVPGTKTSLCRCGASARKPLCDGSHNRVGFSSDGTTGDLSG